MSRPFCLILCCLWMSPVYGKPPLENALGGPAALVAPNRRIPLQPTSKTSNGEKDIDAEMIARDPNALVTFLKDNPERMSVEKMNPSVVLTVAQLLLEGQAWLLAEKFLHDAVAKWPDRADLKRSYGRVLIQLGRPQHSVKILLAAETLNPRDATVQFLLGLTYVRTKPTTEVLRKKALRAFRRVLELEPAFVDPTGWSARTIRAQIDRMEGRSALPAGHPTGP